MVDTSFMARFRLLITAVFFAAFALASLDVSDCHVVKGKLSCLDCKQDHDLSGIKVMVKCDGVKKASVATTEDDGSFEAELPSTKAAAATTTDEGKTAAAPTLSCLAKVLGGPDQLYASRDHVVAKVVEVEGRDGTATSYGLATPLAVSTACPPTKECGAYNMVGSSKTVDLPLPKEWGLAPSSYYVPFIPIIGIP
ncbi:uncharacterized protein LOC104433964 [Eucalyptus grandis]|uniref:Uncharacterized protein n=2 Tax=Eucalyptus grandis TaxID=71139 RepID=A0ACC3LZ45_EUCGR|nr:uncharacterized protein LOC104433964 [Eucalyptus grandis]KAK3443764.1 hypothetical protein EUGRSUZ_B03836 [Eucalyptus grandis]